MMDIHPIISIAQRAGQQVMQFWRQPIAVSLKADQSPVTVADQRAHQLIEQGLQRLTPTIPILSEEGAQVAWRQRKQWQTYWLVDPLDGTKDFLQGRAEFTVNIALIDQHTPRLAVVYAPALAKLYYAVQGQGAYVQAEQQLAQSIQVCQQVPHKPRVISSRFHPDSQLHRQLQRLEDYQLITAGSSLKFGIVAEGDADVYLRLGATSQWDTAAGQCILEAAGGQVVDLQWQPLHYNQQASLINPHFLACGASVQYWQTVFADSF